ncbi:MAG: hypothetical protein GAK43_00705 [Stenotrophomonas maltophilia]|nr:MAG: hypothetical protein GAK43_00705 [Stenotrophomonas maltophilia]
MSDKTKAYRVVGIDLDIDGERIPEGSEISLVAEPPSKLARWLEPIESDARKGAKKEETKA